MKHVLKWLKDVLCAWYCKRQREDMTYTWTNWKKLEHNPDPYIDWAMAEASENRIVDDPSTAVDGDFFLLKSGFDFLKDNDWTVITGLEQIVVPILARNQKLKEDQTGPMKPVPEDLPDGCKGPHNTKIRKDTVIAGVIDVGMPLGHRRTRFENGKTRLLAAWQMIGNWELKKQEKIPFGCEFYEDELNQMLERHGSSMTGSLDEAAFHKELGILNFNQVTRQTMVAHRASHGAHVLDMMAGSDAKVEHEDEFAERVRIIAVNAPSSSVFGSSGTYLDSYMLHAIQRISDLADAIWEKTFPNETIDGKAGFPIVINMSFGKQAGSKDSLDRFAAALDQFKKARERACKSPIYVIMPTGNDNLMQCNAFISSPEKEPRSLNWRVLPEDQSSNFVEIWTQATEPTKTPTKPKVEISVYAPESTAKIPTVPKLEANGTRVTKLKQNGNVVAHLYASRIYEQTHTRIENKEPPFNPRDVAEEDSKFRYILCLAPTLRLDGLPSVAASGVWTICAQNTSSQTMTSVFSVQTDQGLTPNRSINRRSYFDDSGYQKYGLNGRKLESYSYPKDAKGEFQNTDIIADTPVRRHGTINASAAHFAVARVGGYRASDGRPAFYSSTGHGRRDGSDSGQATQSITGKNGARAPTAAFPTDDGPAHGGILSAGATDGSRVAMRGTSFASSQAAKLMLDEVLAGRAMANEDQTINQIAKNTEGKLEPYLPQEITYDAELIEVFGGGRISRQQQRHPRRRDGSPFDKGT